MADHHHHHHQQHHQNHPSTCCSSSFIHGCSFDCNQTLHCHSPPLYSIDPCVESLDSHKLYAQNHRFYGLQNPNKGFHHHKQQRQRNQHPTDLLISSLISRIEALEASLSHFTLNQCRETGDYGWYSLREVAARVIQTHFRAFLVRRSRTLGQLKDLAIIKSSFSSLKSSISDESNADFYSVSRKAVDLLVKLDSIQIDDSMVRDGKRSLSRDLVRFLEFIEGVSVKRHGLYFKSKNKKNNVRFGPIGDRHRTFVNRKCSDLDGHLREIIGKSKEKLEKIRGYTRVARNDDEDVVLEGFQHVNGDGYDEEVVEEENPVVVIREKRDSSNNGVLVKKKSVSFAENKNLLKLFSNSDESASNEDGSGGLDGDSTTSSEDQNHEVEEIKVFSLGAEDDGDEDANVANKGSSRRPGISRYEGQDGRFLFAAPLPVQMEEKSDLLKWRNEVKILR